MSWQFDQSLGSESNENPTATILTKGDGTDASNASGQDVSNPTEQASSKMSATTNISYKTQANKVDRHIQIVGKDSSLHHMPKLEPFHKLFSSDPERTNMTPIQNQQLLPICQPKEHTSVNAKQIASKPPMNQVVSESSTSSVSLNSILNSQGSFLMDQLASSNHLLPWSDNFSVPGGYPPYGAELSFSSDTAMNLLAEKSSANTRSDNIMDCGVDKIPTMSESLISRFSQLENNNNSMMFNTVEKGDGNKSESGGENKNTGHSSGLGKSYSNVLHSQNPSSINQTNTMPGILQAHEYHQQQSICPKPGPSTSTSQSSMIPPHQRLPDQISFNYHQKPQQQARQVNSELATVSSGFHSPYQIRSGYYDQNLSLLNPTACSNREDLDSTNGNANSGYFPRSNAYNERGFISVSSSNSALNSNSTGKRRGKLPFFTSSTGNDGYNQLNSDLYGECPSNQESCEHYSRKVFVGGLPPDIDEEEIKASFRRFGSLVVDWPHKAESKSYFPPKGYAFLLFHEESSVQALIDACLQEDEKLYLCVSSPTIKDKPVQIRPWRLSDADFVLDSTLALDPRKTVFVGGVPRPLKASELATIMNNLYGGVCYAGIDTDPDLKYPKGAGRVAFSNHQSYIAAISARFVHLHHSEIEKRVEVKPYVLDDQFCDECHGSRCGNKFAPFFCANITCLRYYCENCWSTIHSQTGREFHKPLVKEGADRPRGVPYRWC